MAFDTGIFTTNCTLPPEGVHWVSNPNVRSTLTILWMSLLTIFLCTWTVQHLSIPPPNASRFATVWRKVKWMMVMIIAPEFMVGKSCSDWVAAVASEPCPTMQEHASKYNTRWTTTHGFLVHGLNCNTTLNMDECTCAVRVPPTTPTTSVGSTHSLPDLTSTEPPAISTTPPPAGQNIRSTGPPLLSPKAGATPDPISTDVVPAAQFTVSNGLTPPTPQAGAALELSSRNLDMDATTAPPAQITPVVDVKPVASLPAAAQDGESNELTSRTPQAGAALELSSTDFDVDAVAVSAAQTTPVVDVKPVASALAANQHGKSSGHASPSPQAGGTLDLAATDVDMEAAKRVPSVQITPAADETTATSVLAAGQDGESNKLLTTSPISQAGETLHPAATDADIETAMCVSHAPVTPAADETTATSVHVACEDDEESTGLTSPIAQAEALLELSMSLKVEVDIEAARTVPSAKIQPMADGKTTLWNRLKIRILHRHDRNHVWHERPPWNLRLKKRILHRNDRNHVWGERPPRNLVDHGKSWYRTCRCKPIQIDFPFAANSAQLCVLLSSGIIDRLPCITEAQIKDKSKEDVVVKVLALLQVLQLVVELIIRKVYGLATSPLEIAALGFSVCAGLTYLFWLGKPKDIHAPTDIYITRNLNDADKEQVRWLNSHGYFKSALLNNSQSMPKEYIPHDFYNTEAVLRDAYSLSGRDNIFILTGEDIGFAVGGLIFGAFHCFAWNFVFPTLIERTLWRVSSVFTSASVPLFYVIWYIVPVFTADRPDRRWPWRVRALLLRPFFLLYIVCRLFIIVEAVRSLFFLPQAAFISTWSVNIPHLG